MTRLVCVVLHDKKLLQDKGKTMSSSMSSVMHPTKQQIHLNHALYGVHDMLTITPVMAQSWYTSGSIDHDVHHHCVIASERDLLVTYESAYTYS